MTFFDPPLNSKGQPYGPERYKEIVKERYLISKNINTSYNEVGKITPLEREYIIEFLVDEIKQSKKLADERNKQLNSK